MPLVVLSDALPPVSRTPPTVELPLIWGRCTLLAEATLLNKDRSEASAAEYALFARTTSFKAFAKSDFKLI